MPKTIRSDCPALFVALIIATIAIPISAEQPDDILIVANVNVPQEELSEIEVRSIFLGQRQTWSSGQRIVAVNAKAGTELRRQFQDHIIDMSPRKEASYWEDQKIRHGFAPPVQFSNPLKAVFSLKGAISYIHRKDFKEGVAKVLLVVPSCDY